MSKQTYLKTINFPEYSKLLAAAKENKERIDSLVINNDSDKKMLKEERAQTNKFIKEFKANAKAVREKVLGEFDPKVKELSSVLEETQLLCKDKVEVYDQAWKDKRSLWIGDAIKIRMTDDISDFVSFNDLYDPKYLNTSTNEKKIAEDLDNKVSKIKSDLQVAQAISPQVAAIFKECLDIPEAIAQDKRQQEEQAKREAIAKAAAEREEAERKKALEREKELARQAMIKSELEEAKENGEVIDAQKMVEINAKADTYAEKEEIKVATFTVTFEYKDSDYPLAWENPIDDIKERLQGLSNVKVLGE
ncbi:hypothetical protein [Lactococcus petauri]|uniref:hypothetical protein n=1 Tax=Lactococcus petauri TaxID=1940789 RepID=UPI001BCFB005|nr:hypothetical protein [Lactococcus petauri]MBS4460226.1 hypothetical protein [Lactococcus petauri]